jgi:hypothetical protein
MFLADGLPDIPTQLSALAILAFVVGWFLRRMDRTDAQRDSELRSKDQEVTTLQTRVDTLVMDNAEQHRLKHDAQGKYAASAGILKLFKRQARKCTCGAMLPLSAFLDDEVETL